MTRLGFAREVARWEFARYFKWKQQLIGMLITVVAGGGTVAVARMADKDEHDPVDVAVINTAQLPFAIPPETPVRLRSAAPGEMAALTEAVGRDELAGVLTIESPDRAELLLRKRGDWVEVVHASLSAARQQHRIAEAGLTPARFAGIVQPVELNVRDHELARPRAARGAVVVTLLLLGLMVMAVMTGMGYVFASITGEKQIRVTEQVISAIPAQSWMDGKILGLVAVSVVSVFNTALASAALYLIIRVFRPSLPLPDIFADPVLVVLVILFALLACLFWFAFLAAVAAMIDDPHTSTRGGLLMLPMLGAGVGFVGALNPDGAATRVLSLVPPTSATTMPARLVLTEVPAWEVALSLLLLAVAVVLLRTAAGRVFRLAMLMYGKEPTWGEVRRWIGQPDAR